jgi:hypothetical protein
MLIKTKKTMWCSLASPNALILAIELEDNSAIANDGVQL